MCARSRNRHIQAASKTARTCRLRKVRLDCGHGPAKPAGLSGSARGGRGSRSRDQSHRDHVHELCAVGATPRRPRLLLRGRRRRVVRGRVQCVLRGVPQRAHQCANAGVEQSSAPMKPIAFTRIQSSKHEETAPIRDRQSHVRPWAAWADCSWMRFEPWAPHASPPRASRRRTARCISCCRCAPDP
eukprot:Amastigsp_a374_425.p1 type:complete len:186 gc:universal Amastigsp_a374_425:198-755(+)